MRILSKGAIASGILMLMVLLLLAACGGGGDGEDKTNQTDQTKTTAATTDTSSGKEVTIVIGNLTDVTGVSSAAQEILNIALKDAVGYFNDQKLIPNATLKIVTYDGQFDPAKDMPGYEWLKERGAKLIVTGVTSTPVTLKDTVNKEHIPLFCLSGVLETLSPPGYVFAPATLTEHEQMTLIKWVAEHDWDYKTKGPAKIGAASWAEPNSLNAVKTLETYVKAHPDQFQWVGTYLTQVGSFNWSSEAEALKDCDYVFANAPIMSFVREYRMIGGKGKFLGGGPHIALMKGIYDASLWDEIDGMLFASPAAWWGEDDMLAELRETLLYQNNPGKAKEIKQNGGAYNGFDNYYVVLDIVRKATEAVGAENVTSEEIYKAATSYSLTINGIERYSFTETKRNSCNYYCILRADKNREDLVRTDPNWYPTQTEP